MKTLLLGVSLTGIILAQANFWRPDVGGYAGVQDFSHWRNRSSAPGNDLVRGGVFGVRVGWDLSRRWAVETTYGYGVNNLRLFPVPAGQTESKGPPSIGLGARNHHVSINPVFHFASRSARVRPYLTAGPGILWYEPTAEAQAFARSPQAAALAAVSLDGRYGPAFNWGGGVKFLLTRAFEFRVDARNIISQNPHFVLPSSPTGPGGAYITRKGLQSGFQVTGGLGLRTAGDAPAGVRRQVTVSIEGDRGALPVGGSRTLTARTDLPPEVPATYTWTHNGQSMDTVGPSYNLPGRTVGPQQLCVSVVAPNRSAGSDCATINVVEGESRGITVTLNAEPAAVMPGQNSRITATTSLQPAVAPQIAWTLNGAPVTGSGATYAFDSKNHPPGKYEICATVTAPGYDSSKSCTTVVVQDCGKPAISVGGDVTREIFSGEKATIPFTAQPNACGQAPRISYRAPEGTVAAAAQGAEYDSTGVGFNMGDRSRLQRKTVIITATATDDLGATATAESRVIVKLAPVAQRIDDVVFSRNSDRVNNCGKRLLLEVLVPKLQQDPRARVILVGHRDQSETAVRGRTRRGRRSSSVTVALDRARVLNAAAVISAGTGVCPSIELSRVQVAYAGTTQNTEALLSFCGASTQRRGSSRDTRAQFQRLEVWLVPDGAPLPAGVTGLANAPVAEIRAKGCPK